MIDNDEKRLKALRLTPIGDVWGIGRRLSPKMQEWGVMTALDFVERPCEWVQARLGVNGVRTWNELRGVACVAEELDERRKSISVLIPKTVSMVFRLLCVTLYFCSIAPSTSQPL